MTRRRFMLLGQILGGIQVWDIRRAVQALPILPGMDSLKIKLHSEGFTGVNVLSAALFE